MKTLKLFNAVSAKASTDAPFISELGIIITPSALWAKDKIIDYYLREQLNGNDLNRTFHKSWEKIKKSTRFELLVEQIRHYISTYGSDFKDEIYIPDEVLDIPGLKITYKAIKGYEKSEMIEKCLSLLQSGVAMKEETINEVLSLLIDEYKYVFTGEEKIKNKEAIVKLADMYGIMPADTMEFFRYIIFRATGQSLLIKNDKMIAAIKATNYNPSVQFNKFGLDKLATIFNRFKPLFLAFKPICGGTINKIAKLSKLCHVPMVQNPLNRATSIALTATDIHWLDNATPYALFKVIAACYSRINGQDSFVYRIRNGKSWAEQRETDDVNQENLDFILTYLKSRFNLTGKKIYLPVDIKYALPTSEKMFVGNIPTGTRFYGNKLAVGIYWEDAWGANDIDLSGMSTEYKVGWNSGYNYGDGALMYSGDITSAPNGAVEYLYANNKLDITTTVKMNIYRGDEDSEYKIVVGSGDEITRDYMMNPNNLFVDIKCKAVQKEMILGILTPKKEKQCFVLLNFGAGNTIVSRSGDLNDLTVKSLQQQWGKPFSFNKLVKLLGAEIVESAEEAEYNFALDSLEKDSFMKLFK